jgi:CRP/FNR family transcriptional regulator
MPAHSKTWYLQRLSLLEALPDSVRETLKHAAQMFEAKRGHRLYVPGDPSDKVFLLKAGVVKIAAVGPDNREVILSLLYPGDIVGELALVDESPRDHLAEVHEDAVLCEVDKPSMLRLMRESPELGYRITKIMGIRLKQLQSRYEQLVFKSAAARVAETLVDLAKDRGVTDARGTMVPFRLSQRELASIVGLTRETVNVVLQEFRHRGLIEVQAGRIRLLDSQKLRAVG